MEHLESGLFSTILFFSRLISLANLLTSTNNFACNFFFQKWNIIKFEVITNKTRTLAVVMPDLFLETVCDVRTDRSTRCRSVSNESSALMMTSSGALEGF